MIGGNITVSVQIKTAGTKNKVGEMTSNWEKVQDVIGWLDLLGEDTKYTAYMAKVQESTHIFISDYVELDSRIKAENSRLADENGLIYDIMLIDDPMNMHEHLEIYLKYTGGQ